ncbi:S24 family peptidase [Chryseobacterium lathyri]|uniref:Peptidase S24/S26A/S26B/S26C domain-containing protein n=1 Tax=Chryseobacterium lathyri TaxID=395933 RepID=A0A511YFZ1_9FLAO|nr:S24 family peptidase [Chryseobacterium lathyri]GEN74122.1 hypothetical protein CLA01_41940 [Chryseobacterium lathyri]
MNENQKLKSYISYLINNGRVANQQEFGQVLGYKNKTSFSRLLSKPLTDKFIKNVQTCFPDYANWKDQIDNDIKRVDSVTPIPFENYMMVEYVDLSVAAGELGGNNVDELPESKKRLVPKEFDNGEYLVTRVDGDSMDDGSKYSIPDGTEILIKKYYLNNGDKMPIRNNLFVINAKDGKALKQIIEHNLDDGFIVCHSYNPDFKDYKIYMEDIIEIFLYRKIVSLRPPIPDIKN